MIFNRALRTRLSGDRVKAAQYERAARAAMGEMLEQMHRGHRTFAATTISLGNDVTATLSYFGGLPVVNINAPVEERAPKSLVVRMLAGFVTKPRMIGAVVDPAPIDITNGENAFGQEAHVLLRNTEGDLSKSPDWISHYYDATYLPTGYNPKLIYKTTSNGAVLFGTGLVETGNVDWRNASESLSVNWIGNPARSVGFGNNQYWVFFNGRMILDLAAYEQQAPGFVNYRKVNCACLRIIDNQLYLYVLAAPQDFDNSTSFRLYRALLFSHEALLWWNLGTTVGAPQISQVWNSEVEIVIDIPLDAGLANLAYVSQGAFNQSGNKAYVIVLADDAAFEGVRSFELRVTLSPTHVASAVYVPMGDIKVTRTSTHGTTTMRANADDVYTHVFLNQLPPAPIPAGTYVWPLSLTRGGPFGDGTGIGSESYGGINYSPLLGISGSRTVAEVVTGSPIPIGVDFRNDIPARLYWKPGALAVSASYTAGFNNAFVITGSKSETYSAVERTAIYEEVDKTNRYEGSNTWSGSGSVTGSSLTVQVDGEGPWLTLSPSVSVTASGTSASMVRKHYNSITNRAAAGSVTDADIERLWDSEHSDVRSATVASTLTEALFWFLDLRYDAVTYSFTTQTVTATQTFNRTGSGSGTGDAFLESSIEVPTTTGSNTKTGLRTHAHAVRVLFNRVEVANTTATWTVNTSSAISLSGAVLINPTVGWAGQSIWSVENEPGIPWGDSANGFGLVDRSKNAVANTDLYIVRDGLLDGPPLAVNLAETVVFPYLTPVTINVTEGEWPQYSTNALSNGLNISWWGTATNWMGQVDTDIRTTPNLALQKGWGTWIVHDSRWAFSIPWPVNAIATPGWYSRIEGDAEPDNDLPALTGDRVPLPELYGTMWPLSRSVTYLPRGITRADIVKLFK